MPNRTASVTFASLLTLGLASGAMAEQAKTPAAAAHPAAVHPRASDAGHRLANQERRTAEGVDRGRMDRWQAERDRRREEWAERQRRREEMMRDAHGAMGEELRLDRDAAMRDRSGDWAEQRGMNQLPDRHDVMTDGRVAMTGQPKVNSPSDPNTIHINTPGQ